MEILELDRRASAPLRKAATTVDATVTDGAPACLRPVTHLGRDPRWTP